MSEQEMVLFANDAFYHAFGARDFNALETLWAADAPCSCVHPGWAPIFGREEVVESWAAIIANPDSPDINVLNARAQIYGPTAVVLCYEEIDGQYLVATNVFVREDGLWKIVHHQATPAADPPEADDRAEGAPVH